LFSHGLAVTAFGPLVTELQRALAADKSMISFMYAALATGFLGAVFSGSNWTARAGLKAVFAGGTAGFAVCATGFSYSESALAAACWLLFTGYLGGLLQFGCNAAIGAAFSQNRTVHLNMLHTFFGIGAVAGPRLAARLLDHGAAWGNAYRIPALFAVVGASLALLARFPRQNAAAASGIRGLRPLRSPRVRLAAILIQCYVGAEVALSVWGPAYMEELHGLPPQIASNYLSYFWMAMVAGRLLCAPLARIVRPPLLLNSLAAGALLFILLFWWADQPIGLAVALTAAGLFCSGIFPTLLGLTGDLCPEDIPAATTIVMVASAMGNLTFPWLAGILAGAWSLHSSMALITALMMAVTAAATGLRRVERQRAPTA